jgi:glycosyltransferase involved in cell wall biosynthesis
MTSVVTPTVPTAAVTEPDRPSSSPEPFDAHVVLLHNYIPPHALAVYIELARRVRKLTVLLSTPMESNRNWKPDFGTLDVRVQRTVTLQRPWKHPTGFRDRLYVHIPWNTMGLLRELRPDVVISGEMGVRSLLSACYTMLSPRTPLVLHAAMSEHTEQGRGWMRYLLRRWLLRRATCIGVNGASGARYLRKLGFDPARIFHTPYTAVPLFDRVPLTRSAEDAHRLLYVGQLIERKGLVPFVEGLARWATRHPDRLVEFDLAGSGPLEARLRSTSRPDNLQLRFLGERNYSELSECFANSGILAFPTLADEWGMVVNEALAAGLPVLGSRYSQGVEELCPEGQTGWNFRTDVPEELDGAIDRALTTSVEALNAMRAAGHARVEHLTPAYAADRFLDTIKAALADVKTT